MQVKEEREPIDLKYIGNYRFHESYEPTEEDFKKPWW